MTTHQHHIDLSKLKEFGEKGVRRGAIFLGLGLNAANKKDFLDYELKKVPSPDGKVRFPIEFFPEQLPAERVEHFKAEFARWIQDCCLCDLLEHHALFLDQIHLHGLVVLKSKKALPEGLDQEKAHNQFRQLGIPGKHKVLKDRFGVAPTHSGATDKLYEARNALTHDFGYLVPKRCDEKGEFILQWPKFHIFGVGKDSGEEFALADMMGVPTKEDMVISLRVAMEESKYKMGERINLSVEDLESVLNFFHSFAIPETLQAFADYAKAMGVSQKSEA